MDFIKKISVMNWIKIGAGVVVLIFIGVYFSQKATTKLTTSTTNTTNTVQTTNTNTTTGTTTSKPKAVPTSAANVVNKCNFKVNYPVIGSSVAFPLTVTGILNNADLSKGCVWRNAGDNAGYMEVFYNNGMGWQSSGVSVPVLLKGIPGLASSTMSFSASVNVYTTALGLRTGSAIKLVFTELNVPPVANPQTFYYQTYLK